jgi:acyl carrier protein
MLELDQDMEADLGIDTVKQAETFASIRESFDIPVQEGLNLRDYPTLQSVIEFVRTNAAGPGGCESAAVPSQQRSRRQPIAAFSNRQSPQSTDPVIEKVLEVVSAKTGYPTEMLELDQDMEADLGIDTVKQAETFASIRESFDIPVQEGLNLRDYPTLQSVIDFVRTMRPDLAEGRRRQGRGARGEPAAQSPNRPNLLISNLQSQR